MHLSELLKKKEKKRKKRFAKDIKQINEMHMTSKTELSCHKFPLIVSNQHPAYMHTKHSFRVKGRLKSVKRKKDLCYKTLKDTITPLNRTINPNALHLCIISVMHTKTQLVLHRRECMNRQNVIFPVWLARKCSWAGKCRERWNSQRKRNVMRTMTSVRKKTKVSILRWLGGCTPL